MRKPHHDRSARPIYGICVEGTLDDDWGEWFSGMVVAAGDASGGAPTTTLTGPVRDQVALRGLLGRLWDLNLTIVSVMRLQPDPASVPAQKD